MSTQQVIRETKGPLVALQAWLDHIEFHRCTLQVGLASVRELATDALAHLETLEVKPR